MPLFIGFLVIFNLLMSATSGKFHTAFLHSVSKYIPYVSQFTISLIVKCGKSRSAGIQKGLARQADVLPQNTTIGVGYELGEWIWAIRVQHSLKAMHFVIPDASARIRHFEG